MFRDFQAISGPQSIILRKRAKSHARKEQGTNDDAGKGAAMARLTERAFENAVVRLRDGQGALGQSALDALHEQREELANQMLARLAGSDAVLCHVGAQLRALPAAYDLLRVRHDGGGDEVPRAGRRVRPAARPQPHRVHQDAPEEHRQPGEEARPQGLPHDAWTPSSRTSSMWPACASCAPSPRTSSPWPRRCWPRMT